VGHLRPWSIHSAFKPHSENPIDDEGDFEYCSRATIMINGQISHEFYILRMGFVKDLLIWRVYLRDSDTG